MKKYLDVVKAELRKYPNPIDLAREILKVLPERTRDVTVKRFGLEGEEPRTLENIGRSYGITRERVRQIESSAFNKIKNTKADQQIYPLVDVLELIIQEEGGVLSESRLLGEILNFESDQFLNDRAIRFILSLHDKFDRIKESEQWKAGWSLDKREFEKAKKIIGEFVNIFEKSKEIIPEADLKSILMKKSGLSEVDILNDNAIISFIEMSKNLGRNPFGQWGKKEWAEISPRGVRDKAYLIMKHYNEPLHFRKITDKINETSFNGRKAFSQTVHNELIKDDRFVLVGRGIYALRGDKSQSEEVKKIITGILKRANKPMSKNEIVDEVLKERDIKQNTIAISLQDSKIFKKTKENKYTLCLSATS